MIILAIFLIFAGLLMFFQPNIIWMIAESWKSSDATEPSSAYVWSTRFGGGMCILAGILYVIVFFFVP